MLSVSQASGSSLALVRVELGLCLVFWLRTLTCLARASLKKGGSLEPLRHHAEHGSAQQSAGHKAQRMHKSKQDLALTSRSGQSPTRSAQQTYKDSNVFGGTVDGPTWRGIFGDVLHCDGSQVDSCWQPDDNLALMPFERPAVSWVNIWLQQNTRAMNDVWANTTTRVA